ncbi:MAG: YicC family protein [Deltaproteobacteria bacterium]|nr:MAG: YicC family protein [Deltaproteobacteria bacterium]
MTIRSMTGFGRGTVEHQGRIWTVEVRTVNNRFLDCNLRLPKEYHALEERVRKRIGEYHARGRVELMVSVHGDSSDLVQLSYNETLAKRYLEALDGIAEQFGITGEISAVQLTSYPDVLVRERQEEDLEVVWPCLGAALDSALAACEEMRCREGAALAADLETRIAAFTALVLQVEEALPEVQQIREAQLQARLEKLLDGVAVDPQRLAQEVAILVDKADVTEELVRIRSHLQQFCGFLEKGQEVGRKCDFLIQELLREVNTIASKSSDAGIAHLTVALKSELEKIREQVQNVE